MNEKIEMYKTYLTDVVDLIIDPAPNYRENNKKYICPFCGSGSGENQTGAFSVDERAMSWRCFSCGEHGDVFDLLSNYYDCGFREAKEYLKKMINTGELDKHDHDHITEYRERKRQRQQRQKDDYTSLCLTYHSLGDAHGYWESRGISQRLIDEFNLGSAYYWVHPSVSDDIIGSKVITIPTSPYSYVVRLVEDHNGRRYYNVGESHLLNRDALIHQTGDNIFITEGEIDALSIMEVSGINNAVALGSVSNINRLIEGLKKFPLKSKLILCPDNDAVGHAAFKELYDKLKNMNIDCCIANISDNCKDANGLLIADRERLAQNIKELM